MSMENDIITLTGKGLSTGEETSLITAFSSHSATAPSGTGPPHYRGFTVKLRHATLCRTPLG